MTLPLSKAEAESDPAWFDHFCFIGMGDHFIQFDYTPDQDCQLILPLQVDKHLDSLRSVKLFIHYDSFCLTMDMTALLMALSGNTL